MVDVPLPDEKTGGWRVSFGRKIGQVNMPGGVELECEPDGSHASSVFDQKVRQYLRSGDLSHGSGSGYAVCMDLRSGKYVRMDWVNRAR